ncbi:MAG: tetratricopeptide repeat protein [Candidatus Omnitrophica bacterium]|nr:tetratricopeptide repeat protein [Candidatus Omnitrophota bacterium]
MKRIVLLTGLLIISSQAYAAPGYRDVNEGNAAFAKGDFKKAVEQYEKAAEQNPQEPLIDYDLGTAYYKSGDFDKSVDRRQEGGQQGPLQPGERFI